MQPSPCKIIVKYKGNIEEATPDSDKWSFSENGGLTSSASSSHVTLTSTYVGSSASLSAVIATMDNYLPNGSRIWRIGNSSTILNNYSIYRDAADEAYIGNARGAALYINTDDKTYDVGGMRVMSDRNIYRLAKSTGDGYLDGTDTTLSGVKEEATWDSTTGRIQLACSSSNSGVMILSDLMSETELTTTLDAVKTLKVAFEVS